MNLILNFFHPIRSLTILFLLFAFHLNAQKKASYKYPSSDAITISSKILNEKRKIYIHAPKADASNPDKRYPVLYLLDGESHFDMISQYVDYMSRWDVDVIPEMIVVGIANTKRTRDFTPTESIITYLGEPDSSATSWMKPSGGNEKFLQFIKDKLMPYVEANYKTQSFRILAGHSFGGLASINCMLTQPDMFKAYVAVSPSFWWDNEYLIKLADKKLKKGAEFNKILFCSDGSEGIDDSSTYHTNLLKFDSLLTKKALTDFEYTYNYYPVEIHMTVPLKSYYDALRFIYKDWSIPPQKPRLVSASFIMNHYAKLSKKYGYTILPNESNIDSWGNHLVINNGTVENGISLLEMNTVNYPDSFKAFTKLGDAYVKIGEKKKAIDCYQKAIALNPKHKDAKAKLQALNEGK